MNLFTACENNNVKEVLGCLHLRDGVEDLNVLHDYKIYKATLVHHASQFGRTSIVKELLEHGADANIFNTVGRLPIHDACVGGHHAVLDILLKYTKDVNSKDKQDQTAFHISCYHGELSCMKVLLENKCNCELTDVAGRSGLDLAVMKDHDKVLRELILYQPVLLNRENMDGRTAFHFACQHGAINCVRYLIQNHRQHSTTVDRNGILPVHYAAKHGKPGVLRYLLQRWSHHLDSDNMYRTVAHYAAMSSSLECLHFSIENFSDLSLQDELGNTILHYACMNKCGAEMINCLMTRGANFEIENKNGDTPKYCARKAGISNAFKSAKSGLIECKYCMKKNKKIQYETTQSSSVVELQLSHQKEKYENPFPTYRGSQRISGGGISSQPRKGLIKTFHGK